MLPEDDQPAARSEQQVLKAAATHPDDHGEAGNSSRFSRRRGTGDRWEEVHRGDVDAAPDSGSDDMDHDDPHGKPVASDFEDDRPRVPDDHIPGFDSDEHSESDGGLYDHEDGSKSWQVTKAMRAHLDRSLRAIRERTATDFIFPPPRASMQRAGASAESAAVRCAYVWVPHQTWLHLQVPSCPPCPVHGFPADDEQDFVTQHGSVRPRRVSGLTQCTSGYLVGTLHKCHKCI